MKERLREALIDQEPGMDILIVGDQEDPPFVNALKENIPGLKVSFSGVSPTLETLATDGDSDKENAAQQQAATQVKVHDLSNKTEEDAVVAQAINDGINDPDNSVAYLPPNEKEETSEWSESFKRQYERHGGQVVESTESLIDAIKTRVK